MSEQRPRYNPAQDPRLTNAMQARNNVPDWWKQLADLGLSSGVTLELLPAGTQQRLADQGAEIGRLRAEMETVARQRDDWYAQYLDALQENAVPVDVAKELRAAQDRADRVEGWARRWKRAARRIRQTRRAFIRLADHLDQDRNAGHERAEGTVTALRATLARFVDDEPCRLDHHGDCQEHGLSNPCKVVEARRLLAEPTDA